MNVTLTDVWLMVFLGMFLYILANPDELGRWQARAELAFVEEADRLGVWGD